MVLDRGVLGSVPGLYRIIDRPRICHIITGLDDGGAEAVLFALCNATKDRFNHSVISMMGPGKYGPMLQAIGIDVRCLGLTRGVVRPSAAFRLWRMLRQVQPDIVQTWMYHADLLGGVVAKLAGVKRVLWGVHHSTLEGERAMTRGVARVCALISKRVPERIISCSYEGSRTHGELGYRRDKMLVVPNGYDTDRFRTDHAARLYWRGRLGSNPDEFLMGVVARWHPNKDHVNLLDALAGMQIKSIKWRCLLIGSGMDQDNKALVALIADRGLESSVVLMGRQSDVPCIMNALDLHILPSRTEACPNVVAEAMACGTPCVATDVGDVGRMVGTAGWVVPARDAERLSLAIEEAMLAAADVDRWMHLKSAARSNIVSNFSLQGMISGYANAWSAQTPP